MQRMYCSSIYIILAVAIVLSCDFAAMSPFATFKGARDKQDEDQILQSSKRALDINQEYDFKGLKGTDADHHEVKEAEKECKRQIGRPGSMPPKCEHKCRGCQPCIAVQVPETAHHLVVEYTNYEPEGWVCKCGSSLFVP